jgi:exonuclease VII small subunit
LFKEGRTLVARCEALLKNAEETLRAADGTASAAAAERGDDGERPDEAAPF